MTQNIKNNFSIMISMAGWEDRFREGTINNFQFLNENAVIFIFHTKKYEDRTLENRKSVFQAANEQGFQTKELLIDEEGNADSFLSLKNTIENLEKLTEKNVLVDVSTMNRENIWYVLFILNNIGTKIHYVYYPSLEHGKGELTKDPSRPRFLFKMSGEPKLGKKTAVVALTGFDSERTFHFVNHFDPDQTRLGIQTGRQLDNYARNIEMYSEDKISDCKLFPINSYNSEKCTSDLIKEIADLYESHNIIITSLGPKPGSISCFEIWSRMNSLALAYIPVNEVSETYSHGTDLNGLIGPSLVHCSKPNTHNKNSFKIEFKKSTTLEALTKSTEEYSLPLPDYIDLSDYESFPILHYDIDDLEKNIYNNLLSLKTSISE